MRAGLVKVFVPKEMLTSLNRAGATPRLHSRDVRRNDAWSSLVVNESRQSRVRSVRQNLRKAAEAIVANLHFAFAFGVKKLGVAPLVN